MPDYSLIIHDLTLCQQEDTKLSKFSITYYIYVDLNSENLLRAAPMIKKKKKKMILLIITVICRGKSDNKNNGNLHLWSDVPTTLDSL